MVAAVSPPLMFGWSLDDIMIRNDGQNMLTSILEDIDTASDDSLLRDDSPSPDDNDRKRPRRPTVDDFTHFSSTVVKDKDKKLNHNASERDRRKRINDMYSSLRSLLPQPDQMKKLSIPATVSRVLKYIPELQKELESLREKKEGLMKEKRKRAEMEENSYNSLLLEEKQRKLAPNMPCSSSAVVVSATRVSEKDIMIQISITKKNKGCFALVLSNLEQDGFVLQDSSSFESFEDHRIFYNLHLQQQQQQMVEGSHERIVEVEELKEKVSKILLLCEKQEEPLRLNFGSSNLNRAM